ncbi:DUF6939 family protein [Acanthopleuribacter pedis]|uniref:Uncharacterized protein n=1 Tax=Acanthopleuribacter pedis TaxID=442870 RepID=A0A8J7PYL4_9BACT|nr:hypothetical protein [Acanthopleuribacter pedis]MBO1317032.1 hypothetical protein [Acanthopleuribacter pedis]
MPLILESRRKKPETLQRLYPDAVLIDVTSKGPLPWQKFSPFFPHGDIPVPFSSGITAASVEGVWQGLKVFEGTGIDRAKFDVTTMKGLKRTVRKFGPVLGHQKGVDGKEHLDYISARKTIYLPMYHWVLENKLQAECNKLRRLAAQHTVLLLDYETNADLEDPRKPLSHASLIIAYLAK